MAGLDPLDARDRSFGCPPKEADQAIREPFDGSIPNLHVQPSKLDARVLIVSMSVTEGSWSGHGSLHRRQRAFDPRDGYSRCPESKSSTWGPSPTRTEDGSYEDRRSIPTDRGHESFGRAIDPSMPGNETTCPPDRSLHVAGSKVRCPVCESKRPRSHRLASAIARTCALDRVATFPDREEKDARSRRDPLRPRCEGFRDRSGCSVGLAADLRWRS